MTHLIIEQIERRARLEHARDVSKAAADYFRDHPEEWQRCSGWYSDMVSAFNTGRAVDLKSEGRP
jgi:hypothetical protein